MAANPRQPRSGLKRSAATNNRRQFTIVAARWNAAGRMTVVCAGRSLDRSQGDNTMCDYSLEHVASRPAAVADRLIVTPFPGTITRGFAGAGDVNTAVCLRPGTELAFDEPVRHEHPVTHWPTAMSGNLARFRQVNLEVPHTHHDALEFSDGTIVLLARLVPGQRATVLQLPSVPLNLAATVEQAQLADHVRTADPIR